MYDLLRLLSSHFPGTSCCVVVFAFMLSSHFDLQKSRVQIWLFEQVNTRIEGKLIVSRNLTSVSLTQCNMPFLWSGSAIMDSITGHLDVQGFDEFMNVVLDDTEELDLKKKTRKPLGRIMLKGDNITLIAAAPAKDGEPAGGAGR
jgi:small nuclear ribonucleoprotein E